jgi:hypothetical protein
MSLSLWIRQKKTLIKHYWKNTTSQSLKLSLCPFSSDRNLIVQQILRGADCWSKFPFPPEAFFLCLCPRGLPGSKWHQSQLQSIFHTNFNMLQLKRTLAFRKSYTIQSKNILCRCRHQLLICKKLKKISYKSVKMYSTQTHRKF